MSEQHHRAGGHRRLPVKDRNLLALWWLLYPLGILLGWVWLGEDAPGAVLSPILVVGGTDGRSMEPVSEDVYRFMPIHFSLKETAMIHGTNEHLKIDSLARMIDFYGRLIATSAG